MDLTGYPHTVCIQLMDSSLDDRSYTLCACCSFLFASFVVLRGCHCPLFWVNGMRYLPRSSLLPMKMGFLWHVISTSSSLNTVTLSLVKMDTLPLSFLLPHSLEMLGFL